MKPAKKRVRKPTGKPMGRPKRPPAPIKPAEDTRQRIPLELAWK